MTPVNAEQTPKRAAVLPTGFGVVGVGIDDVHEAADLAFVAGEDAHVAHGDHGGGEVAAEFGGIEVVVDAAAGVRLGHERLVRRE